ANLHGVDVELVTGSLLDRDLVTSLTQQAQAVVHLAALPSVPRSIADPVSSWDVNATGTLNILEGARATGAHVVYASSSSVYGSAPQLPKHEELPTWPLSPYAASKLAGEALVLAYGRSYRLPVLPFRFFNVYGPGQPAGHAYAAVIPTFLDCALRGLPLPVYGDGEQSRDFTYVGTVVEVIAQALAQQVISEEPVNLAFGSRATLLELIAEIAEQLGHELAVLHQPPRPGDIRHSQAANARLRRLFPDVAPVPLRSGLTETLRWFREAGR
ncbi:MAG: NAD-dependent epimerase/dehydratase family protein, partial [Mycobacteriales bacterium]